MAKSSNKNSYDSSDSSPRTVNDLYADTLAQAESKNHKVKKKKHKKKHKNDLAVKADLSNVRALHGDKVVAFFDVDNTLVQGASIVHYARGLARRNYFGYSELLGFVWSQLKFRLVGKENHNDIDKSRDQALSFIKGRKAQEFFDLGEELYEECIGKNLWSGTCELAEAHLKAGRQVWIVTATPEILAETIALKLGFSGALGTVVETDKGFFTGNLIGGILHGQAKANAVLELAREERINLLDSYAYSDSINDLPLLSLVGHPVAINPDPKLKEHAKEHGWEIHDFRIGRKAAKIGVQALLIGAAGAGGAAAVTLTRKSNK